MNSKTYFYKDKPLFGLDIGHGSIKVMQLEADEKKPMIVGFGHIAFEPSAVKDGVIVRPEVLAAATKELFARHLIGAITTKRVAITVPAARCFTRAITLPKLNKKELAEAVQLGVEQYVPVPVTELYLDYTVVRETADNLELFVVAAPKKMVDSYLTFTRMIGLETVLIQTTLDGVARLFKQSEQSDVPSVLIDFGSLSADISVFDKSLIVSGIAPGGGDIFTILIAKELGVNPQEAHLIKTKYGINRSKKQVEILAAVEPMLAQVVKEIRRIIRYYEERYGVECKIAQVVAVGGGTNMPGLPEYLTNQLRIATRTYDPWLYLDTKLAMPSHSERLLYTTVAGLGLVNPKEVFAP